MRDYNLHPSAAGNMEQRIMRIKWKTTSSAAAVGMALALAGCPSAPKPPPPQPVAVPVTRPNIATDVVARVKQSRLVLEQFRFRAQQLPGHSRADHRRMMADSFTDLLALLPAIHGQISDGGFDQAIRVIRESHDRLVSLSPDSSAAPTVSTGLHSTLEALNSIYARQFMDQSGLSGQLDALSKKLADLDITPAALGEQAAAEATRQIGQILQEMSDTLAVRAGVATGPTTAPSTRPLEVKRIMAWVSLCDVSELHEGTGKYVEIDGFRLAVFLHLGKIYAIDNMCPHAGGSLSGGIVEDGCVVCPWHYWRFELATGALKGAPLVTIQTYPTRVLNRDTGKSLAQANLPLF